VWRRPLGAGAAGAAARAPRPQRQSAAEARAARQFWYTDKTARAVARAVARAAGGGAVACVACPSLFRALRAAFPALRSHLLEIDERFRALGPFSLYDYREPCAVAPELHHAFSVVVADPPYLVRLGLPTA